MNNDNKFVIHDSSVISSTIVPDHTGIIYPESSVREHSGKLLCPTDTETINNDSHDNTTPHELTARIYRYKFSEPFIANMHVFSKVHQYDSREDFKDAWKVWTETNAELVNNETKRLQNMNYCGDILDKMYKSARYYFRNKKETIGKKESIRSEYVNMDKELLYVMDEHISRNVLSSVKIKPSNGVQEFQQLYSEYIKEKTANLLERGFDESMIQNKIKKTYKNRYFIMMTEKEK
jgi:hypothetical protein